jgi:hypothetical protein
MEAQVVAPVRETCAQALGALLRHELAGDFVPGVLQQLTLLLNSSQWEVRLPNDRVFSLVPMWHVRGGVASSDAISVLRSSKSFGAIRLTSSSGSPWGPSGPEVPCGRSLPRGAAVSAYAVASGGDAGIDACG